MVDGDTIDVAIGGRDERVRLIGIDTPETQSPDGAAECFGPEASAFTAACSRPAPPCGSNATSSDATTTAGCSAYVYRLDDGLFVNEEIVRAGLRHTADDRAERRRSPPAFVAAADRRRARRTRPVGGLRTGR